MKIKREEVELTYQITNIKEKYLHVVQHALERYIEDEKILLCNKEKAIEVNTMIDDALMKSMY